MNSRIFVVATLLVLTASGAAHATLIGQDITCQSNSPALPCDLASNTVGPGVEFTVGANQFGQTFDINVGDASISILKTHPNSIFGSPGTITLGDLFWSNDPTAIIQSITNFDTNVPAFLLANIVNGDNFVMIEFANEWPAGANTAFVSFDLVTSHDVPEPSTLAVFCLGLAAIGFLQKRMAA